MNLEDSELCAALRYIGLLVMNVSIAIHFIDMVSALGTSASIAYLGFGVMVISWTGEYALNGMRAARANTIIHNRVMEDIQKNGVEVVSHEPGGYPPGFIPMNQDGDQFASMEDGGSVPPVVNVDPGSGQYL